MIRGRVTAAGVPTVIIRLGDRDCRATVDTGFNGDLELSESLRTAMHPRFVGRVVSELAGGQRIEEDAYVVEVMFDGQMVEAVATFVAEEGVLIGTHLLHAHRLEIAFKSRRLTLERET